MLYNSYMCYVIKYKYMYSLHVYMNVIIIVYQLAITNASYCTLFEPAYFPYQYRNRKRDEK